MKTINRVNVAENTIEKITLFDSEITRWFDRNRYEIETDLVKLNSNVPGMGDAHDLELERVEMLLRHYCAAGYTLNNKVYAPTFAAASDVRKATSTWINREIAPSFWKWAMCGLTLPDISGKIALNKYMAYIGLLASASKPFSDVFGKEFDVSRIAVVPDAYVAVDGVVDFVNADDTIEHKVNRKVEINAFDGFAIIRSDLTKGESCTLRGPWLKIFAQATNWSKLFVWAKANGKDSFVDYYGTTRYLKDVDLIITESCFKAKKLYKSWEQYTHAFKELGHTVCVCVQEHAPHAKGMPYQQGQTLQGSEEDALLFAEYAKETVSKYEKEHNAIELLSGAHRAVARMYPTLLAESHTARTIQEKYTSKRNQMLGGRIPELGFNAFLAPDMVAFAQHVFGLEITGSLKAGECSVSTMPKGLVDVTRSPHLDNAHVLLSNQQTMSLVPSTTPTMFINIFDLTPIRLRADYDGDHVWYSDDPLLIALVKKTESVLDNLPIDRLSADLNQRPDTPEIERHDLPDIGTDEHVGLVDGEFAARELVVQDAEGFQQHVGDAQLFERLGGCRIFQRIHIHGNDHIRPQRAAHRHGHRIDELPVDKHAPVPLNRGKHAGNRHRCAHGRNQIPVLHHDRLARVEVGGHRRKRHRQVGKTLRRNDLPQHLLNAPPCNQCLHGGEVE